MLTYLSILGLAVSALLFAAQRQRTARLQLNQLIERETFAGPAENRDETTSRNSIDKLNDRFGRAGIILADDRAFVSQLRLYLPLLLASLGFLLTAWNGTIVTIAIVTVLFAYAGLLAWYAYLGYRRRCFILEVKYRLPIVLETFILLVDSGLGLLPAIEKSTKSADNCVISTILSMVYQLTHAGLPLSSALALVSEKVENKSLRHVLMHLDISGNEGGELIPALKSLSDFSHTEWKLSVENRVKRLENLVVFPVFASVIGLLFLTASVPLLPLFEFRQSLATGNVHSSSAQSTTADIANPITSGR